MAEKRPTDSAIIRGFENFEKGFVVYEKLHRLGGDEENYKSMWTAHSIFRAVAVEAQLRIEKKEEGDGD